MAKRSNGHAPRAVLFCASVVGLCSISSGALIAQQPYEVVIRGGRVVDGSGAPWHLADLGIRSGKIARIGRTEAAARQRVIEAVGLVVAPGCSDTWGQTA